jgi:serine/threonine protein kinase
MTVGFPLVTGDPSEIAGYKLHARLGAGGMGTVYLSFTRGGRPVAIKVVKREFADDPEFRRRFHREVEAAQQVQGHYTAPVLDADPNAPIPWLATAYIAGPSLAVAVGEHGPLPPLSVFRLLAGAAEGIAAIHVAGLIHRDLKPANVLLAADGPRVIDFGIARAANSSTLTGRGNAIGTPAYMAPEQVRGKATEATDVFALGQLAVYAATGHPAFGEGHSDTLFYRILNEPPELDDCPDTLRPVVAQCLAKDPADRPAVEEVMEYARAATTGQTVRLADDSWLPAPIAVALKSYTPAMIPGYPQDSDTAAPFQSPSSPRSLSLSGSTTPSADPGSVGAASNRDALDRRPLRLTVGLLLAVLLLGGYLAYQLGRSHSLSAGPSPGASASTTLSPPVARRSTTPATHRPTSATPQTSSSDADYTQEWNGEGRNFKMPGGPCSNFNPTFPSYVYFAPDKEPQVGPPVGFPQTQDDLDVTCNANGAYGGLGISFNDQAAEISGTPDANACDQAATTSPLKKSDIPYTQLSTGMHFCIINDQTGLLVLLTFQEVDTKGYFHWLARAWFVQNP